MTDWAWDETLYAGAAPYYAVGRMPYLSPVADALRDALGLDGTGRLLDVGCGPGSLTLLLAPLFAETVGLDPDPGMLAAAADRPDVRWVQGRAEDIGPDLGTFDVVTFAQSFHWTDRARVARLVAERLTVDGVLVIVGATTNRGVPGADPLPHPRPPHDAVEALIDRWLGSARRAGQGRRPATPVDREDLILRAAGYDGPRRVEVGGGEVVRRTEDEVVAATFSLSYAAPHLFGERVDEFEAELRTLLRRTGPDGVFSERRREIALDLYRFRGGSTPR